MLRLGYVFQDGGDYLAALETASWDVDLKELTRFTIVDADGDLAELSTTDGSFSLEMLPSLTSSTICSDVVAQAQVQLTPELVMGVRFHSVMRFWGGGDRAYKGGSSYCEPVAVLDVFGDCDYFYYYGCLASSCVNYFFNDLCELTIWNGTCRAIGTACRCL